MTKIAIASCCKIKGQKSMPVQPAWDSIAAEKPDLLLLLGDNVYMSQASGPRWKLKNLEAMYRLQMKESHFAALLAKVDFLAVWDDHDFGPNDSRGDTAQDRPFRDKSRVLFHKYTKGAINTNRPEVYSSHVVDDVKVIMLDVRYYKTDLSAKHPTILGAEQEDWLTQELKHSHEYTIVASGTGLEDGSPQDKWSAYKVAHARLVAQLRMVPRLLLVTGDVHRNGFEDRGGFFEVISSGVGRTEGGKPLDNYGVLEFGASKVRVRLLGNRKKDRRDVEIKTSTWSVA